MASFKFKPVSAAELQKLIAEAPQRGRTSKGAEMIEEFLATSEQAVTVPFASTKERNAVAISAANYCRANDRKVWIRKQGGGQGTDLLLVNLAKANAETRRAYENRPRPGRKPSR